VCGSLRRGNRRIAAGPRLLTKGEVFDRDFLEAYMELKWEEVYKTSSTPRTRFEFQMYSRCEPPQHLKTQRGRQRCPALRF